jgi:hypothetical protein
VEEAYQLALRIEKQLGLSVGRKVTSWDSKSEPVPLSSTQRLPSLRVQTRSGVSGDYKGKPKPLTKDHNVISVKASDTMLLCVLQGIKS